MSACSRLPFRFRVSDSTSVRQRTPGPAGQQIIISVIVIIEVVICIWVPVVFCTAVFIVVTILPDRVPRKGR